MCNPPIARKKPLSNATAQALEASRPVGGLIEDTQRRLLGALEGSGWLVHRVAADGDCQFAALYAAVLLQDKALTWNPYRARSAPM